MSYINFILDLINKFDQSFVQSIFSERTILFTRFSLFVDNLVVAYIVAIFSIILLVVVLCWKNRQDLILPFAVTTIGAIVTSETLKRLIGRARPDIFLSTLTENGFSMPSIHATFAMALYGFFIYFGFKVFKNAFYRIILVILGTMLIFFIGFSRIYIGVHYPSDILAGFIVGFIWLLIGISTKKATV